jgi:hypothetical protein
LTPRDDRFLDMPSSAQFDAAIEQVLRGGAVGDDVATFARFVDDMRVMGDRPPPPPSPKLAALLAGTPAGSQARASVAPFRWRAKSRLRARSVQPRSGRSRTAGIRLRLVAMPIAGKAAVFLAVATCAAAGAASGILPEPATHFLRRAIEVVTPFELPDDASARPGRGERRVDNTGTISGDEPSDAGTSPAGSPPAAVASDAGAARDQDGEAGTGSRPEANATDEASSGAETGSEPGASAWPPKAARPASSPPPGLGPKVAPPDAGQPTEPAPKTGHVPPGNGAPGTPHPGGPGSGDALLMDPGTRTERPRAPAPKGPSARRGSPDEPLSDAPRDRPHHGPPPGVGPGQSSSGGASTGGPRPVPSSGTSPGYGPDRGQHGQHHPHGCQAADCGPRGPHNSERAPGGDTSAHPVDAAAPLAPPP